MKKGLFRAAAFALSLVMAVSLMSVSVFAANANGTYTDISGNANAAAIEALAEAGIMIGVGDGKFEPDETVNRAMAITVLGRMAGAKEDPAGADSFDDVDGSSWYGGYVGWAVKYGIVFGDGEGHCMPYSPVTGEQMDLMLSRYAKVARLDYTASNTSKDPLTRGELAGMVYAVYGLKAAGPEGPFDYAEVIAAKQAEVDLVPAAADIAITVTSAMDADGVVLVPGSDGYYLNAYVANDELTFSATGEVQIVSAVSSAAGNLAVSKAGTVSITPAALEADDATSDEVITITMADETEYKVHTRHNMLPSMTITGEGVDEANAGVYAFALDKFMLRVNTDGELVYYRDMNCVGEELMCENFSAQEVGGVNYYSMFVELRPEYRNINGGFSSGMYVLLDENYKQIGDSITLLPHGDHGEGYLDQHEFVVLGKDHYLLLSYSLEQVSNLPETVSVRKDGTAFVWAGIMQEVKGGKVIWEIDTADYPMLYDSAVEKIDYAGSTDQGIYTENAATGALVLSISEGIMDYVHVNSMDYILNADGTVAKLLVSMRDQSAVYQFDTATGEIEWILGGKASTLTGYDEYTRLRTDDNGKEFNALTFGQHDARYLNRNADGSLTGNPVISLFDNQTGIGPFVTTPLNPGPTTLTRTFVAEIDPTAKTATLDKVINGTELNKLSDKYHIASHCGSAIYANDNSVTIGWGLHGVIDNIPSFAVDGGIPDPGQGYFNLRIGSRPVFTEYDMENGVITFELTAIRNPGCASHEAFFSYRTYKTTT